MISDRTSVAGPVLLIALLTAVTAAAAAVEVDEVIGYLGFDAAAKQQLLAGEIVSRRTPESKEATELSIAVAGLVPGSLEGTADAVLRGEMLKADPNVIAFGEIGSWPPAEADFAGAGFDVAEADEVAKLLRFGGGTDFNLSPAEIARFRALGKRFSAAAEAREAVSAEYRHALLERYREYREKGLAGIAPYDRGGKRVSPGEKLRLAGAAATFFQKHEPELYRAFAEFPRRDAAGVEHRFYWIKQRVQDRPTFLLSHRMLLRKPGQLVQAERQYYIGHSYNSVQIVTGALPVGDRMAVFYSNRTSIDQLAGMTGRVARPIAASRLIERVVARFERIRGAR